ncbi:MAG: hypothetical protein F6K50_03315 [Moorea sp. SIO3I7]|nr:hypothetical protein [Moorena sp. SIO3I7]
MKTTKTAKITERFISDHHNFAPLKIDTTTEYCLEDGETWHDVAVRLIDKPNPLICDYRRAIALLDINYRETMEPTTALLLGKCYAVLGDKEKAKSWLNNASNEGFSSEKEAKALFQIVQNSPHSVLTYIGHNFSTRGGSNERLLKNIQYIEQQLEELK